ncbi:MAG: response regulator transcription factor [Ruminiclostridium sp.]
MNILIVDDEEQIREGLANTINWSAYSINKTFTAENAWKALDIVKTNFISLIITDIKMPGMMGIEFIQKAASIDENIKFIVISSYDNFDYVRAALKLKVIDYLIKPVNISELIQLVCKNITYTPEKQVVHIADQNYVHEENIYENLHENTEIYSLLVKRCMVYVDKHFYDTVTLGDLAEAMERNPSYISHIFKSETGKTLTEYLNELRIKRAIQLMNSSNLLLYEIATMVGFESYRNFINMFKKSTGKIPTQYCGK